MRTTTRDTLDPSPPGERAAPQKMQQEDIDAAYDRSIRAMFTAARLITSIPLRQYAKHYVAFLLGAQDEPSAKHLIMKDARTVQSTLNALNRKRIAALTAKLEIG